MSYTVSILSRIRPMTRGEYDIIYIHNTHIVYKLKIINKFTSSVLSFTNNIIHIYDVNIRDKKN